MLASLIACSSSKPTPIIANAAPVAHETACSRTAQILAAQGTASPAIVKWRQTTVQRLCSDDSWPDRVRECAATATHDPLSCTSYLETDEQRAHWNTAFEKWVETAGQ